eukprot:IDg5822t1
MTRPSRRSTCAARAGYTPCAPLVHIFHRSISNISFNTCAVVGSRRDITDKYNPVPADKSSAPAFLAQSACARAAPSTGRRIMNLTSTDTTSSPRFGPNTTTLYESPSLPPIEYTGFSIQPKLRRPPFEYRASPAANIRAIATRRRVRYAAGVSHVQIASAARRVRDHTQSLAAVSALLAASVSLASVSCVQRSIAPVDAVRVLPLVPPLISATPVTGAPAAPSAGSKVVVAVAGSTTSALAAVASDPALPS